MTDQNCNHCGEQAPPDQHSTCDYCGAPIRTDATDTVTLSWDDAARLVRVLDLFNEETLKRVQDARRQDNDVVARMLSKTHASDVALRDRIVTAGNL